MSNFSIKLTPESQVKINAMARAGKLDLRPTLNVIGKGYRKEVDMIFDHQQPRNVGARWPQLSTRYAAWKAARYPGKPILVRTGKLKRSMVAEGSPGNISVIGRTGATFGTTVEYGIYHDSDSPRKKGLPRRNFSEPSERRKQIWVDQIEKDIRHNFEVNGIKVEGAVMA